MKRLAFIFFLLISCTLVAQNLNKNDSKLLPSEALALTYHLVNNNPTSDRIATIGHLLPRTITENLSRKERFLLGEMYFWNFKPKKGIQIYDSLTQGTDSIARASWQRGLQIRFRAFDEHKKVEKLIKQYRKKFKPLAEDRNGLFGQVYNLGAQYAKNNEHKKVVQLILEEFDYLDYKGAYRSYQLPAFFNKSFRATGNINLGIQLLNKAIKNLTLTLNERKKNIPKKDISYAVYTRNVSGMETVATEKIGYKQTNDKFEQLINQLKSYVKSFEALKVK